MFWYCYNAFFGIVKKKTYYQIKWTKHSTKHNVRYKNKKESRQKGNIKSQSYQCCHHKPQLLFSTWRSGPGPGWPCWVMRSPDRGSHKRRLYCPKPGASIWFGCVAPQEHCKWIGLHLLRNCVRDQRWRLPPEKVGHKLERETCTSYLPCTQYFINN